MTREKLDNLVKIGQLKAEDATPEEIRGLIRSGTARLNDSKNDSLSIESRFDLAYNAAHALSLAALRHSGYRSESRYLVFQCLQHTIDLPNEQWRVLDQAHRKRNIAEYEGDMDIDDQLVEAGFSKVNIAASTGIGPLSYCSHAHESDIGAFQSVHAVLGSRSTAICSGA